MPIFAEAGLRVGDHPYFDPATSELDSGGMVRALRHASPGDIGLFHGCCHNTTGTGFSRDQWRVLADPLVERGLVPFIDLADQGLDDGLDEDAAGLRLLLDTVAEPKKIDIRQRRARSRIMTPPQPDGHSMSAARCDRGPLNGTRMS